MSKKHACIDVHGKNHLICDYNSRNKTRRNQVRISIHCFCTPNPVSINSMHQPKLIFSISFQMSLKPQAFYELVNEVELMFGDVKCQYLFSKAEDLVCTVYTV